MATIIKFVLPLFAFDEIHTYGSYQQEYSGENQHIDFGREHSFRGLTSEQGATYGGRYDLGYADGSIEQSQIDAHMASRQCIGQQGEG